jgi:hypothetical protein
MKKIRDTRKLNSSMTKKIRNMKQTRIKLRL